MAKVAVVVTHGMGSQGPDFDQDFKDKLFARLERLGADTADVAWQSIYWAPVMETAQNNYLQSAGSAVGGFFGLREFVVRALGDAAGYSATSGSPDSSYTKIHDLVRSGIANLYHNKLAGNPVPMIIMAHSLGGHIMSNYIYDTQPPLRATGAAPDASGFEKMDWLAGIVTFGCNIPLFTFAYDPITPIQVPSPTLPPEVEAKAKWLNFFDKQDVLGYPLKPINAAYNTIVDEDTRIDAGWWPLSTTPLSHTKYWTDRSLINPAAEFLNTFL